MTPHRVLPLAALLATVLLGGCGASDDGSLDSQAATPTPTCLVHQANQPANRYTDGTGADTRSVLEMMRYYTANGTKAFCDGKPPTSTDLRWMNLYTTLGGDGAHVPARPADKP
ncbi:hypothetical protein [Kitasatospora sp. NBC_00315]|uniref:hypothetical protein n=1 Tax=Kitasatospora sp. NBC_00315 TaxID=2975963 RepID=UPI003253B738